MATTETYAEWIEAIMSHGDDLRVPPHLVGVVYSGLREWHDEGVSVNDAVVQLRNINARRKADAKALPTEGDIQEALDFGKTAEQHIRRQA